jgi:hypothetical protein
MLLLLLLLLTCRQAMLQMIPQLQLICHVLPDPQGKLLF